MPAYTSTFHAINFLRLLCILAQILFRDTISYMRPDYIVDTHSHIEMIEGLTVDETLRQASEYGVKKIILPCSDPDDLNIVNELSVKYPNVYSLLGVHPNDAGKWNDNLIDKIKNFISNNKKVVGIGEIGLDYHYGKDDAEKQRKVFIKQLKLANELNLPICVHDRDAHGETLDILKEYNKNSKVVMHCFSGSVEFMRECIKMGMYIALGGVVTFKNAAKTHEVAREIPLEKLLLETDAPFLTPEPHRGEENRPAYTKFVAERIAFLKGLPIEEVIAQTTINAHALYNLGVILL